MKHAFLLRFAGTLLSVAVLAPLPALAKPLEFSVESSVRLGYDANPFLLGGDDVSSGYVDAQITPKIAKRTEKGTTELKAHYGRTQYQKRYSGSDRYGAVLQTQQQLSQKLNVFGALRYDNSVVGENGGLDDDSVSGAPIDDTDISQIGLRRREQVMSASGGFQYKMSPKDTISVDGGYTATRFDKGGADSDTMGGRVAYQRAISERTKVGVAGSLYRIDYDTPGLHTLIYQPTVTFSTALSATWQVDASLGMSFSRLTVPGPGDGWSKGFAGSVKLCHEGQKTNYCLLADRSVSASGFGGTQQRTQIGFNFDRQLTERLWGTANGSYARSSSQNSLFGLRQYVSGQAGLEYRATDWLRLGAAAHYRDVFGQGFPVKADMGGEISATVVVPRPK